MNLKLSFVLLLLLAACTSAPKPRFSRYIPEPPLPPLPPVNRRIVALPATFVAPSEPKRFALHWEYFADPSYIVFNVYSTTSLLRVYRNKDWEYFGTTTNLGYPFLATNEYRFFTVTASNVIDHQESDPSPLPY